MEGRIFWKRQRQLFYRILAANVCKAQAYAFYTEFGDAATLRVLGAPADGRIVFSGPDQMHVTDSSNRVCVYFSNVKSWKVYQVPGDRHHVEFYSLPWAWQDRFSELPTVLMLLIANMLSVNDLFTLRTVSSRSRAVCSNDALWMPRARHITLRLLRYGIEEKLAEAGFKAVARMLLRTNDESSVGRSDYAMCRVASVMSNHSNLTPDLARYQQIIAKNL